jgi:hypothetical protein
MARTVRLDTEMRTTSLLGALLASLTACGGTVSKLDGGRPDGSSDVDAGMPLSDSALGADAFDGGSPSDSAACGEDGACAMGTVCAEDLCIPCGEPGMPCCAGEFCDPPANACIRHVCMAMR